MKSSSRGIAIETSGRIGSVALVESRRVLAEEQFLHGLAHAAQMVPILDRLSRAHGWTPRDVSEIYVSIGPGSFTGLRIGVTLAKTMAFATGAKIVAVSSVRVLAENAPHEAKHVVIVLDAKRGQIFTARFERSTSDEWIEREPAHLDTLPEMLARAPRPLYLLGEGIPYHTMNVPQDDAAIIIAPEHSWRPRAAAVAKLGVEISSRSEFADPFTLTPIYIRRPEAEEKTGDTGTR